MVVDLVLSWNVLEAGVSLYFDTSGGSAKLSSDGELIMTPVKMSSPLVCPLCARYDSS